MRGRWPPIYPTGRQIASNPEERGISPICHSRTALLARRPRKQARHQPFSPGLLPHRHGLAPPRGAAAHDDSTRSRSLKRADNTYRIRPIAVRPDAHQSIRLRRELRRPRVKHRRASTTDRGATTFTGRRPRTARRPGRRGRAGPGLSTPPTRRAPGPRAFLSSTAALRASTARAGRRAPRATWPLARCSSTPTP